MRVLVFVRPQTFFYLSMQQSDHPSTAKIIPHSRNARVIPQHHAATFRKIIQKNLRNNLTFPSQIGIITLWSLKVGIDLLQ